MRIKPQHAFALTVMGTPGAWATGGVNASLDFFNSSLAPLSLLSLSNPKEACFAAGTKVWTDKGLVSIELLKVGDMVLSQDEATGVRAYKPITRTFVHHNQPICDITYETADADGDTLSITANHPVWVVDNGLEKGWVKVGDIPRWSEVLLAEGSPAWVVSWKIAYRWTHEPKDSWSKDFWLYDVWDEMSITPLMSEGLPLPIEVGESVPHTSGHVDVEGSELKPYTADVFNIEVEDFHTYFVGGYGLWVHNKNPIELKLFKDSNGVLPLKGPR